MHVRVQNLIVDYIDYASASGTLQNQACPACRCPTGSFHLIDQSWPMRSSATEAAEVAAAWAEEGSRAAVRRRCQSFGLQTDQAPLRSVAPGLDPHSGVAYARLHNDFEGIGKVSYEAMLQRKQQQLGRGWRAFERELDAWVTSAARFTKFTTFTHGLSHYFYRAPDQRGRGGGRGRSGRARGGGGRGRGAADDGGGGTTVRFGKITSKQVYRDIFRFWRVLLLDILPDDVGLFEAISCYLTWLNDANAPAHVKATLLSCDDLWADAIRGLVSEFGAELYAARVKTCLHRHASRAVRWNGALRNHSDELHLETSHLRGVKEPWRHTNHKKPTLQMARYVSRRDVVEMLEDRYVEQRAQRSQQGATADSPATAHAAAALAPTANQLMGTAPTAKRSYPLRCSFDRLKELSEALEHLAFAARQFLHLDTDEDGEAAAARFPHFDSDAVHVRPGVHLYQRLDDGRVQVGGRELHACTLQPQQQPVFVAIESADVHGRPVTYYGLLVLCFVGVYLGEQRHLCYVRWLHTARAIAQAADRTPTADETRGPFETYRWAVYPRGRAGHPRQGGPWYGAVHASKIMYRVHMVRSMRDEGLYRLNTDVWLPYL